MFVIARYQENIVLNDYEFVVSEDNVILTFETELKAIEYLNKVTGNNFDNNEWEENGVFIVETNCKL